MGDQDSVSAQEHWNVAKYVDYKLTEIEKTLEERKVWPLWIAISALAASHSYLLLKVFGIAP